MIEDAREKAGREKTRVVKRRTILPDGRYLIYFSFPDSGMDNRPQDVGPFKPTNNQDV